MTINCLSLELHARSWLKERVWLQERLVDDLKPVGTTVMNTITNTLCVLDPILQCVSRQPQLWIIILSCEHCITDAKPETFTQFFCIWATSALAICTKLSNTNTYTWGSVCSVWESWSISSAVRAPSMERIWESFWGFCAEPASNATKDPTTLGAEWKTAALFHIMNSQRIFGGYLVPSCPPSLFSH